MRRWFALLVVAVGALVAPRDSLAQVYPPCPINVQAPVTYDTNSPCIGDSAMFTFRTCGQCVQLSGATWDGPSNTLTIFSYYFPQNCPGAEPCDPETLVIGAGVAQNVGVHWLTLRYVTVLLSDSASACTSSQDVAVAYVAQDCGGPPPPGDSLCVNPPELPIHFSVVPQCPQPGDSVYLRAVSPCAACLDLHYIERDPVRGLIVRSSSGPIEFCSRVDCIQPDVVTYSLGQLAAGFHTIQLTKENWVRNDSTGTQCLIREQDQFSFVIGMDCPDDSLQYVNRVEIGTPQTPGGPRVGCAGEPIPVVLGGMMPGGCIEFRRVEILPKITTDIGPPTLRAVFVRVSCSLGLCGPTPAPWAWAGQLPPLPFGLYRLPIQVAVLDTCDTNEHLVIVDQGQFPFAVVDSCGGPPPPPPYGCFEGSWAGDSSAVCDATVASGRPAVLTMQLKSTVPIAGFQGRLSLGSPALQITGIQSTGVAAGMRVVWNPTPDGATFVLFSETDQLIPPCNPLPMCPACCLPSPVLQVRVHLREGATMPVMVGLTMSGVLAADSLGNAVYSCLSHQRQLDLLTATICADRACDANADGATDIRDLVTMVRCLNHRGCLPDSVNPTGAIDCEHDGDFDLADVICCARVLLRGQMPDSAESVPAPDVYVRFGTPIRTATGLDVPITLHGGTRLSAARLGLTLPLDRFDVNGLTVDEGAEDWLALHEVGDASVSLGLIRLAGLTGPAESSEPVHATLHLALRPGAAPSGELRFDDGDFMGLQGEALIPGTSQESLVLGVGGPGGLIDFAPPRPNPFTREVTFGLALERDGDVELTVHDLNGRRVTTLHRGRLVAGRHAFTWNGRDEQDAVAANGLYFVRARVDGRVLTQKVALLRGR